MCAPVVLNSSGKHRHNKNKVLTETFVPINTSKIVEISCRFGSESSSNDA